MSSKGVNVPKSTLQPVHDQCHSINYDDRACIELYRTPDFCTVNGPHRLPYTHLAGEATVCFFIRR